MGEILEQELTHLSNLTLLDPFAGVGTTIVEGIRRRCDVFAFEINPYAALVCRIEVEALHMEPKKIRRLAEELDEALRRPLNGEQLASRPPVGFQTRDPFFSPKVEQQILRLKDLIDGQKDESLRRLLQGAMGSIIVRVSNYSYEPSLGRRVAAGKNPILDADLAAIMRHKLVGMAQDIDWLKTHNGAPRAVKAKIFNESYLDAALSRLEPVLCQNSGRHSRG